MTKKLQATLKKAVDNLQNDRSKLCPIIKDIVDEIGNLREATAAIIDVEPRLSEKEIFTAYHVAIKKLIPQAWQISRFEVVKFLAKSASLKQQQAMLRNGVLVASRAHPEGHLVRLFDLKNCQIKYAWNYRLGRLFTDEERVSFARQVFTGVPATVRARVLDTVEGSIAVSSYSDNHKTLTITGSVIAKDLAKSAFGNKIKLRHFINHKNLKDYYKDVVKVLKEDDNTFKVCPRDIGPQNFAMDRFGNAVLVLEHGMTFVASEIDLLLVNLFALQLKKELAREITAIDKL